MILKSEGLKSKRLTEMSERVDSERVASNAYERSGQRTRTSSGVGHRDKRVETSNRYPGFLEGMKRRHRHKSRKMSDDCHPVDMTLKTLHYLRDCIVAHRDQNNVSLRQR